MTIEKMYGSYSDADLNDWERFPMNANVLTSSAFGAWLLRRDERRDKAILKADYEARLKENNELINDLEELRTMINKFAESYETRLKADMVAMLTDMLIDVEEIASREQWCDYANDNCISRYDVEDLFQQKINALKAETEDQE